MTIPKLAAALHRVNQGTASFNKAVDSWLKGDFTGYENDLRSSATEAVGALELTLKIYLHSYLSITISTEDLAALSAKPTFHILMTLMTKYGKPKLTSAAASRLYSYRDLLRNAAEHDATVPSIGDLETAILEVRSLMIKYLRVSAAEIKRPRSIARVTNSTRRLLNSYLETVRERMEYLEFAGLSPKIGSKVVKLKLESVFVPLLLKINDPLFEVVVQKSSSRTALVAKTKELLDIYMAVPSQPVHFFKILSHPRVIILGHPGAGKTTVAKYLSFTLSSHRHPIPKFLKESVPICLRAADYASALKESPSLSLFTFIVDRLSAKYGALLELMVRSGKALVIIDGLDEISDSTLRDSVSRNIEIFVTEFRENRYLITSRIVGYRQNQFSAPFEQATLAELNDDQIVKFLENWFAAIEIESNKKLDKAQIVRSAHDLFAALNSNPSIRKLAGNPLLLTIIALTNWRSNKLPTKRVDLYSIATETLIENWPLRQRALRLDSEEIQLILEPVAFHLLQNARDNQITEQELKPLFESQVCERRCLSGSQAAIASRELLDTVERHTGFFLQRGFDEDGNRIYGFLHLTFAEYLAAKYLAERWSENKLDLRSYAHEPKWHEVILLMAGHISTWAISQANKLIGEILQLSSPYEHIMHRDLFLAAEIIGDNVRTGRELLRTVLTQLINIVLTSSVRSLIETATRRIAGISRIHPIPDIESLVDGVTQGEDRIISALVRKALGQNSDEIDRELFRTGDPEFSAQRLSVVAAELLGTTNDYRSGGAMLCQFFDKGLWMTTISDLTAERMRVLFPEIGTIEKLKSLPVEQLSSFNAWLVPRGGYEGLGVQGAVKILLAAEWPLLGVVAHGIEKTAFVNDVFREFLNNIERAEDGAIKRRLASKLSHVASAAGTMMNPASKLLLAKELLEYSKGADTTAIRSQLLYSAKKLLDSTDRPDIAAAELNIEDDSWRGEFIRVVLGSAANGSAGVIAQLKKIFSNGGPESKSAAARVLIRWNEIDESEAGAAVEAAFGDAKNIDVADLVIVAQRVRAPSIRALLATKLDTRLQEVSVRGAKDRVWLRHGGGDFPEAVIVAEKYLFVGDADARYSALQLWGRFRKEAVGSERFKEFLNDSDSGIREEAVHLIKEGELLPELVRELIKIVDESANYLGSIAATKLLAIKDGEMRSEVISQMAAILERNPSNEGAFAVLSNLISIVA